MSQSKHEQTGKALKHPHPECAVDVLPGESGNVKIEQFTVTETEARMWNINCHGRPISPGTYTRLLIDGEVVMSDTQSEIRDHRFFSGTASGNVLITGLGIGMVLKMILAKPAVTRVTVVEANEHVIKLTGPTVRDPRVQIVHADAYTWRPPEGMKFDTAFHDLWNTISHDNKPLFTKLKRHYAPHMSAPGNQTCWGEYELQRRR